MTPKTIVIPEGRNASYEKYHYAPAIRVGDLVIISGVPAGGPGTYSEQVSRMFQRIQTALEAAGASMGDIVEMQSFHAAKSSEEMQKEIDEFLVVYGKFVPSMYPAWTAVGNSSFLAAGAVLEVRVMAIAGSGKGAKILAPAVK